MISRRDVNAFSLGLLTVVLLTGCNRWPGKPEEKDRWIPSTEIMDFNKLYSQRCSGCHGKDGRLGAARPLNDPLYQALASVETLRRVIGKGVPGTSMPAFLDEAGGSLTAKQIDVLVEGMKSSWGHSQTYAGIAIPPYSLEDAIAQGSGPGDVLRGAAVAKTYCAHCHGVDGNGGTKGGSIVDPNYLALVSDQSLRVTVIAGRSDLDIPDWRANLPGQPMTPQEISDVVAWMASHRLRPGQIILPVIGAVAAGQ